MTTSTATTSPTAERPSLSPMLGAKLTLVAFFWGGTFIAGRVLALSMPLMTAAFCRFLVAAVLLLLLSLKLEGGLPRLNRSQMLTTAMLGLTGIFLYSVFFFGALAQIPAGRTALFVSLNPIVTAIAASFIFRERLGAKRWLGIGIALAGAMIVITRGDFLGALHDISQSFGNGEMLMSCAVLSWATYTLISRKAMESLSPVAATTYATLWGLFFLLMASVKEMSSIQWLSLGWSVWASIFYLGAVGTVVAFIWYYQGIKEVGPSRAAVFTNLVPAFGVLLSAGLLQEPILISMLIGGALSAVGVSLTNRK
ncbi:DMT family transporter [Pectobacterium sp. CHL-2024]|uniref:DMT family transporter n=1 Tax=Pectobacterium sp. CHL-2024 TaxID=3377079 RepID=UPI00383A668B